MVLTTDMIRFGLIIFAVLIATLFIGIRREDKLIRSEVFSTDTLRQILAFFVMAGVLCAMSDNYRMPQCATANRGLELLFYASPIVAGGILFFAGAYAYKCGMYKHSDKIRVGRALLFVFPMLFFASMINQNDYLIAVVERNWFANVLSVFGRSYMGLIPLMLILELVLFISFRIFRDEKKVIIIAGVLCIALEFIPLCERQCKVGWNPYTIMFFLGMLFIRYEDRITDLIRKKFFLILPSALFIFAGIAFQEIWFFIALDKRANSPFASHIPFEGHIHAHGIPIGPFSFDHLMLFIASLTLVTMILCLAVKLRISNPVYRILSGFMYEFSWVSILVSYALNINFLNKREAVNFNAYFMNKEIPMVKLTAPDLVTGSYLRYKDLVIYIILVIAVSVIASLILYNPFRILKNRKEA